MKVDLSSVLQSSKTALEKQATDSFGAVAEDFARNSLRLPTSKSGPVVVDAKQTDRQTPRPGTWNASSYAAVLAGATELRPKLKFLFKVEFIFNQAALSQFPPGVARQLQQNRFTFMIKSVDRPKVDFEYEDDVNIYNYRTKALKKIRHRELTVTFMDDVGNNVFDFFRTLLMIYSPITREAVKRDGNVNARPDPRRYELGSGMTFSDLGDFRQDDVAHRGVVNATAGGAIELIRVKQIFIDPGTPAGNSESAVKAVFYDFINPRIVSFDLDDLSHELSEPNLLTMQFDYDWLEMTKHDKILATGDGGPTNDIVLKASASTNGSPGVPADILGGTRQVELTEMSRALNAGRGDGNPFLNILSGAAASATRKLTSDIVNKSVQQIPGLGRFSNTSIGRAVTGGIGNAVSAVAQQTGGIIGGAVSKQVGGLFSSVNQSSARAASPVFSDSSTPTENFRSFERSSDFYAPSNPAPVGDYTPSGGE